MGVICTDNVEPDVLFGPIPPHLTIADPILLIGHMTADNTPDLHTVKININQHCRPSELIEWIPYVRAARNATEQNLEAVLVESQLYYRSTKAISTGSELLVWYTAELARTVGVPDIHPSFITREHLYTCPYCCNEFTYPFSLRTHMRFKCKQNPFIPKSATLNNNNSSGTLNFTTPETKSTDKDSFLQNTVSPQNSSLTSSGSERSPDSSPIKHKRTGKRPRVDLDSSDAVNLVKREAYDNTIKHLPEKLSPGFKSSISLEDSANRSADPMYIEGEESVSAFHKVEKSHPLTAQQTEREPTFDSHTRMRPSFAQHMHYSSRLLTACPPNLYDVPMTVAMRQATKENIPQTIAPMNELPLKNREDLRNLINCGKLPFHPAWRFHFPYIKSPNPIVDNLLTAAATFTLPAPLTQNWCAKCNSTFRMTSDLVYHMRSHHTEEFKKTKTKPVEKLRCDVCGDKFRERHHLTRHMTSHQEA